MTREQTIRLNTLRSRHREVNGFHQITSLGLIELKLFEKGILKNFPIAKANRMRELKMSFDYRTT